MMTKVRKYNLTPITVRNFDEHLHFGTHTFDKSKGRDQKADAPKQKLNVIVFWIAEPVIQFYAPVSIIGNLNYR